jgi:capsular exopolysaccharide synthesis family protein
VETANYFRGLVRSWWLILLIAVAGGAGGYVVYAQQTPQYSSTVTVIVAADSPQADEVSARTLTELRAQTIGGVAPTGPVLEAAAESAGRSADLDGVESGVRVKDSFITVSISGPDPEVVRDIAEAYPSVMPAQTDKLAGATSTPFALNLVSPATLPAKPFSPVLTRLIGFGLAAGLVLGLAAAVLRETLNRTVRDSEDLRRITGLPILGTVPRELGKELLPAMSHPRSARAEAYRQVRTTLLSSSDRRPLVVAVTSATSGEGKTSVSTNLAVVLSRAGHRVALVDADLRRPRVADYMGVDSKVGLTDVLTGETSLADALSLRDDGRFAVLPAGSIPTNPSEALGSVVMREVLAELSSAFEFVIIDTPPVLPVTDALVLSPLVDGMILVARLGYSTRERIERAQLATERVKATLFGVVPNHAGKGADSDYSYAYKQDKGGKERSDAATPVPQPDLQAAEPSATTPTGKRRRTVPVEPEQFEGNLGSHN